MTLSPRQIGLAAAALAVVVVAALGLWLANRGPELVFVDRAEPPGFRNLVYAGAASEGVSPIAPIAPAAAGATPPPAPEDICAALFSDTADPRLGAGAPVVAFFTDYRCPYCREMGRMLIERAKAGEITVIFKEWPVLGPPSVTAARAALAAARQGQGAFLKAHERLTMSPFVPNAAYARDLARWYGLDSDRLLADFDGAEVAAQVERIDVLAEALGFQGVPGLVVGRTVALRALDEESLDALIAAERELGPPPC